jgi:hypothetical protein
MRSKNSTAARRSASRKKARAIEIVVRRGALKRFDALKAKTGELPVVVKWDRRQDDRRDVANADELTRDRRYEERRRKPPFTWDLADFVVVEPAERSNTVQRRPARKRKKPSRKS